MPLAAEQKHLRSSTSSPCGSESSSRSSRACSVSTENEDDIPTGERRLSTFEKVISTHAPIFESFLLQAPTDTIFQLYHTSRFLRNFLRSYPTAWQYLSFRLLYPSGTAVRPTQVGFELVSQRQSCPYALDQLLLQVVIPFSPALRSLDLDNTAVSGQNLISTVLNMRRETLEHLSVRGCKNVSLKYHIIPYLTMFGLQYDADFAKKTSSSQAVKHVALKSLYTYRCRHHRRRPYLTSSLLRRDSDSEPTHELVKLCHKLGIWTDTAWCTTPAGRCFRRRGYVSMRAPQGMPEVWVVFDRLWRSKNWIGSAVDRAEKPKYDGRLWDHDETGSFGEALGTAEGRKRGEGKTVPAHLRRSHRQFVENVKCDACGEDIHERCEQCSVLMHCVGCRKTLCYSCAFDIRYPRRKINDPADETSERFWWAPNATVSPCIMQEPLQSFNAANATNNNPNGAPAILTYPALKFHWCCTEPVFTGGGGISLSGVGRDLDRLRAAPLPRRQGWEDPEFSSNEWSKSFPKYAYGDPKKPDYSLARGHAEMMRWLLGPPEYEPSSCPRNLCQECYDSPQWKVHCKSCSRPLCMEHDLRGLRLGICGYRDLNREKEDLTYPGQPPNANPTSAAGSARVATVATFAAVAAPSNLPESQSSPDQSQLDDAVPSSPIAFSSPIAAPPKLLPDHISTRQTSPAVSNNHTGSSSPSVYFEASPEVPKWHGCLSFFCPSFRVLGDQRQRCASVLNECTSCRVRVCQDCIQTNPPCTCSYCQNNYLCPNCLRDKVRDGTCRRADEEKAKREERRKQDMDRFALALERNLANEVAGFAGQFFGSLAEPQTLPPIPLDTTAAQSSTQGAAAPVQTQPSQTAQPVAATYDDDENDQGGSGSDHTEMLDP